MNESEAFSTVTNIIAGALELPEGRIKPEDTIQTVEGWDSLGHLNILIALDKKFSGRVGKIPELAKATSVEKIVNLLQEYHVI